MTPATPKDAPTRAPADGLTRRQLLQRGLWSVAAAAVGAVSGMALFRARAATHVWQLDPDKCAQCGRCETACVLTPSAVKAVHAYALCGYCKLCGGYHQPQAKRIDTAAENQLCPAGAITRTFI